MVLAHPPAGAGGLVEQVEVRNQPDFVQSGAERLGVVAVRLRAQQVPDLRRRIRPPPALLAQKLKNVLDVASQRGRNALQQPQPQRVVDVPDRKLLEGRAAERVFRARAQIRGEEDAQRGTQRPVRQRIPKLHQLGGRDVEIVVGGYRIVGEHMHIGLAGLASKRPGESGHEIRIQVGHPHAMARNPVPQRLGQARQQHLFDAGCHIAGMDGSEHVAHELRPSDAEIV